jgi:WD40 repeat protein/serine/threonine protein kinase
MSADEMLLEEDQQAFLLAAYDDALAAGNHPEVILPVRTTEGNPDRPLDPAYLSLVRQALRSPAHGMPPTAGTGRAAPIRPAPVPFGTTNAGLPWTSLGKFQIRRELGRGGFGVVFLAYDPLLGREVALKVPRADVLLTPELRERFRREAYAASNLDHPNLVPVYEAGEEGTVCFLIEAYCPGPTLADWLKECTEPVPFRDAAELIAALADAVEHAHQRSVLHRDLKPANVLLHRCFTTEDTEEHRGKAECPLPLCSSVSSVVRNFTPKITDFGLAKLLGSSAERPTHSRTILGTASYIAPEQAAGKSSEHGRAVDIYSLGAILYELLTGRPPFQGENELETLVQVRTREAVLPSRLRPKVPRDLETICLKCLQKEPSKRYASSLALAEDLRHFLAGEPICARPAGYAERIWRWCGRNPVLAVVSGLATAAFLAVFAMSLGFALYQTNMNERLTVAAAHLEQQQKQTQAALNRAERQAALLALDRGMSLCEQGEVRRGLLWLARSLEITSQLPPADAVDLEWGLRANLAHWSCEIFPLRSLLPQKKGTRRVAISPDGKLILTASWEDTEVQAWETACGKPLGSPFASSYLLDLAIPADGRPLALGARRDETFAQLVDALTGLGPPLPQPGIQHVGVGVTLSPDGRLALTAGTDYTAQLWEARSGKRLGSPLRHEDRMTAAAFSPDGRTILTASDDHTARFWSVDTGKPMGPVLQHAQSVEAVAFSPDGQTVLTGCHDRTARLWNATTGEPIGLPLKHGQGIVAVAFSPGGQTVLTSSADRTVRLWEAGTGKPLGRPLVHPEAANAVAISPDGRWICTGGWDYPARVWELPSGKLLVPPLVHPEELRAVAFSPDSGRILTGCKDNCARFWETATGRQIGPTLRHQGRVLDVAYSRDGRTVLTSSFDSTARLWEAATGQPIGPPLEHERQINAVAFSPDDRTALTGSKDGTVRFWEAATGKPLGVLPLARSGAIDSMAYSSDGRTVVILAPTHAAHFWEAATGRLLEPPLQLPSEGSAVAYSPDSRTVLIGMRNMTAQLFDVATRQPVGRFLAHQGTVNSVDFSPDGRMILTGGYDRTVRLWETATGRPIGPPLLHDDTVADAVFSPDGRLVLTGSFDRMARVWWVPPPVAGAPERIRLWVEVITGLELDEEGAIRFLDAPAWHARRQRLQELGGPPTP